MILVDGAAWTRDMPDEHGFFFLEVGAENEEWLLLV